MTGRQTKYTLMTIAGQCRTNPWLAVLDWPRIPECRFRHLQYTWFFSIIKTSGRLWTSRVYPLPPPTVWTCRVYDIPFHHQQWNAGLSSIWSFRYRNEQKYRGRNQFSTGIKGPSPVPECSGTGLRDWMPECRCRCPAILIILIVKDSCFGITFEHEFIIKLVTNCFGFPSFCYMAWVYLICTLYNI